MKASRLIAVVAPMAILLAALGALVSCDSNESTSNEPGDQIRLWICLAEQEPHDFKMTVSEEAKMNGVVCPVCDSIEVFRAGECPTCGRYYPIGRYNASPETCMHCGSDLPGKDVNTLHSHGGH